LISNHIIFLKKLNKLKILNLILKIFFLLFSFHL
jgi:hypothetical protein